MHAIHAAPELVVERCSTPRTADSGQLRNRVVFIYAFQMLCPGCLDHSNPASEVGSREARPRGAPVLGLAPVFERQTRERSRAAQLREVNSLQFRSQLTPPARDPASRRRCAYAPSGTPTFVAIDAAGRMTLHHFGRLEDAQVEAIVADLAVQFVR